MSRTTTTSTTMKTRIVHIFTFQPLKWLLLLLLLLSTNIRVLTKNAKRSRASGRVRSTAARQDDVRGGDSFPRHGCARRLAPLQESRVKSRATRIRIPLHPKSNFRNSKSPTYTHSLLSRCSLRFSFLAQVLVRQSQDPAGDRRRANQVCQTQAAK